MIQFANDVAMCVNNNKGFHGNQGHNHGGKGVILRKKGFYALTVLSLVI